MIKKVKCIKLIEVFLRMRRINAWNNDRVLDFLLGTVCVCAGATDKLDIALATNLRDSFRILNF